MESKEYCGVAVSWLALLLPILSWLDWYAGRLLSIAETKRCPTYKPPFPLPREPIIVYRRSCDTFPASPSYFLSIGKVSIDLNGQQGFSTRFTLSDEIHGFIISSFSFCPFSFSFVRLFLFFFLKTIVRSISTCENRSTTYYVCEVPCSKVKSGSRIKNERYVC